MWVGVRNRVHVADVRLTVRHRGTVSGLKVKGDSHLRAAHVWDWS